MKVRLSGGDDSLELRPMVGQAGASIFYATVDRDVMQRVAAGSRLGVTELEGLNVSRTFELSTVGLSDALGLLQKRCDKREDAGAAAAAPTH